jgi:hypothetical protein
LFLFDCFIAGDASNLLESINQSHLITSSLFFSNTAPDRYGYLVLHQTIRDPLISYQLCIFFGNFSRLIDARLRAEIDDCRGRCATDIGHDVCVAIGNMDEYQART